jgi:hypothetical protein
MSRICAQSVRTSMTRFCPYMELIFNFCKKNNFAKLRKKNMKKVPLNIFEKQSHERTRHAH